MAASEVVTLVVNVLFFLASLAALRLWLRHRSPATGWLLATFGVFDLVILASLLDQSTIEGGLVGRVLVIVLLLAPYLLFRFADAIVSVRVWVRRAADVLMVGATVMTASLPALPGDEGPQTLFATVWFATALGYWAATNVTAGWLLVRASMRARGRPQPPAGAGCRGDRAGARHPDIVVGDQWGGRLRRARGGHGPVHGGAGRALPGGLRPADPAPRPVAPCRRAAPVRRCRGPDGRRFPDRGRRRAGARRPTAARGAGGGAVHRRRRSGRAGG